MTMSPLQWHHDGRDGFWNHRRLDCLFNRLFRCRSKKTSKLRVTGLCEGNSPVAGEFPPQRASNAKNASIWWRHHDHRVSHSFGWKLPWIYVGRPRVYFSAIVQVLTQILSRYHSTLFWFVTTKLWELNLFPLQLNRDLSVILKRIAVVWMLSVWDMVPKK